MKTVHDLPSGEVERILNWVRFLLVLLRCSHWSVQLGDLLYVPEEGESGCSAVLHTHDENNIAMLQVGVGWMGMPTAERRHTLVHEILHLTTKEYRRISDEWASKVPNLPGLALTQLSDAEERMVDQLATVLGPMLPLYEAALEQEPDVRVALEGQLW